MKTTQLVVLLFLVFAVAAKAEPFEASSLGETWSVAGRADGTCEVQSRTVVVKIQNGVIVRQRYGKFPQRKIIGLRAFIAQWSEDGRSFRIAAESEIQPINKVLDFDETVPLGTWKMEIRAKNLNKSDISKTWLGFEIIESHSDGNSERSGTCYFHTKTYLLTGEPTGFPKPRE